MCSGHHPGPPPRKLVVSVMRAVREMRRQQDEESERGGPRLGAVRHLGRDHSLPPSSARPPKTCSSIRSVESSRTVHPEHDPSASVMKNLIYGGDVTPAQRRPVPRRPPEEYDVPLSQQPRKKTQSYTVAPKVDMPALPEDEAPGYPESYGELRSLGQMRMPDGGIFGGGAQGHNWAGGDARLGLPPATPGGWGVPSSSGWGAPPRTPQQQQQQQQPQQTQQQIIDTLRTQVSPVAKAWPVRVPLGWAAVDLVAPWQVSALTSILQANGHLPMGHPGGMGHAQQMQPGELEQRVLYLEAEVADLRSHMVRFSAR